MGFVSAAVSGRRVTLVSSALKEQMLFQLAWLPVLLLSLF